jgi:hypothetical protein
LQGVGRKQVEVSYKESTRKQPMCYLENGDVSGLLVMRPEAPQEAVRSRHIFCDCHAHPCPFIISCVYMHPHNKISRLPANIRVSCPTLEPATVIGIASPKTESEHEIGTFMATHVCGGSHCYMESGVLNVAEMYREE